MRLIAPPLFVSAKINDFGHGPARHDSYSSRGISPNTVRTFPFVAHLNNFLNSMVVSPGCLDTEHVTASKHGRDRRAPPNFVFFS
jgi:hypothetical protein